MTDKEELELLRKMNADQAAILKEVFQRDANGKSYADQLKELQTFHTQYDKLLRSSMETTIPAVLAKLTQRFSEMGCEDLAARVKQIQADFMELAQ